MLSWLTMTKEDWIKAKRWALNFANQLDLERLAYRVTERSGSQ